jgi:tetratricopeptide (TPR) repeat protein
VEGRAALETLDRESVSRARQAFESALRTAPDYSAAHIGMANACVLAFESTRADTAPDLTMLQQATHHAREGCRLDPASGEAWSTLAFVLHRSGDPREAIAAARKAVSIDPDDWRHYLRLAFVTWGEERLRAAHRVLTLCPGLALAHWFAATVFVGRQVFDAALDQLRAGCASQDAQRKESGRFNAVGLHLLHGLVLAAQGDPDRAIEEFAREMAFEADGQLYARECSANTWYAHGAIRLRQGRRDEALAAFREALKRVPGHPLAAVGLGAMSPLSGARPLRQDANTVDAAIVKASALALEGRHGGAALLCGEALAHADPGPAGWLLPVDPLLHATDHRK